MGKSRFTVNQSIPDEYKSLYIRILLIFSEVGIDMMNDCGATHQLGNKNVIDCYLMFNTAISAYHTGDKKACQLLMNYIDKQLDITYKDLDIDESDDNDEDLIEPTFEIDDSVIVHKAIPIKPNVGKKYIFCGGILLKNIIYAHDIEHKILTTYNPFNNQYKAYKDYADAPPGTTYLFYQSHHNYSIDNHINALYVVTITKESIIHNEIDLIGLSNNDDLNYQVYSNFDITKAKIEIYCKSDKIYYTSNSKILLNPPSNIIVHKNETFSSNTHREDYIIKDNKVLYAGGMKQFIQFPHKRNYINIACAKYARKKWKLKLTCLFSKINKNKRIAITTHPLNMLLRYYFVKNARVGTFKGHRMQNDATVVDANYKHHSCRLYPIDRKTNAISIKRFVYNPTKPSLIKYTGLEYDRPTKYKVIKTKRYLKTIINKDYIEGLRYTIFKG